MKTSRKPRVAVWKFASCDGCQLTILDCEKELLQLAQAVEIAYFPEATSIVAPGPYDVSLVEGSITTREDVKRVQKVRRSSRVVVSIGACATAGGIQALRNVANVHAYASRVYPHPEWVEALEKSSPIRNHIYVDYELRGCPISKDQLLEVITALLARRRPQIPTSSVCQECKRKGSSCVLVGKGRACLGPVTQAGCGGLCPSYDRGCYGCFGPSEGANTVALSAAFDRAAIPRDEQERLFRGINGYAEAFRFAADALAEEAVTA